MNLLAIVLAGWACAATPAPTGSTFVSGRISRNLSGSADIYEPFLRVNQWVNAWGGGASVSGSPLNGQLSGGHGYWSFFGSGASAQVSEFSGHYQVNATIRRDRKDVLISFRMTPSGPVNDPAYPPSFNVWDLGASLQLTPSGGGRDYSISGWVDKERFGAEGVALVGIVAAMAMQSRPAASAGPDSLPVPERIQRLLPPATLRF